MVPGPGSTSGITAIALAIPCYAQSQGVSQQEAHDIGVEAYLYFYPIVIMDVTRKQVTNVAPGKEFGRAPMNMFVDNPAYPPAAARDVVRPNFDTLYSTAWLDLTGGPVVVSVPDTGGRFYLLPMIDMWTDVFASPGWRTTERRPATFLLPLPDGPAPCRLA